MLKKIPNIRVPVHNEQHRVGSYSGYSRSSYGEDYTLYNNQVFEDTLEIKDIGKTSSGSPFMKLESVITHYKYTMRWMQMKDYIFNAVIDRGTLSAIFTFDLKWNYFSLVLVDPEALPKLLRQYELKGPRWWDDHQIINLDH